MSELIKATSDSWCPTIIKTLLKINHTLSAPTVNSVIGVTYMLQLVRVFHIDSISNKLLQLVAIIEQIVAIS